MHEPNLPLRWLMFHFAGGDALFVALFALILITAIEKRKPFPARWTLLALTALIWGGISSPAWPLAVLAPLVALMLCWRIVMHVRDGNSRPARTMRWSVQVVSLAMAVGEIWAVRTAPPAADTNRLCIIGDSVTAGVDDGVATWPRRLAEETALSVRDASRAGATLRSALEQADWLEDRNDPLVLEIGGNDLLSALPIDQFRHDCEALCQKVCSPERIVWMLELPLPPLCWQYGCEQRRICRKHGVRLISKRKFMRILTTSGATKDGIHLSANGQRLFCDLMRFETGCMQNGAEGGAYVKCDQRTLHREADATE